MTKFRNLLLISIVLTALNINAQDTLKLTIMTFNLRFGELATIDELAKQIVEVNPDFVALEEVDVNTNRALAPHQNGKNMLSELASKTNMFGLYGKAINFNKGYYGIGILSKYPYIKATKSALPNPKEAESRVLLEGAFEVGKADTIIFATTHLDVTDENTIALQAEYITTHFNDSPYPVIIGGDFNSKPDSKAIKEIMTKNWFNATDSGLTFPATKPKIKIDYIFAKPQNRWKLINTHVIQSTISDHFPIVSELEYVRQQ